MTDVQTNFETDPYDDDLQTLGNIAAVPVIDVGSISRKEAPQYGSWQGYTVPLLGNIPAQLLTRKPLRDEAFIANTQTNAAVSSFSSYGSVTSPGAVATILTVGNGSAPAGLYQVTWTVELEGTVSATDIDNFRLHVNGVGNPFANSLNPGAVGVFPQMPVNEVIGTTGVSIQTVNAGTVGAIYSAHMSLTPIPNPVLGNAVVLSHRPEPLQQSTPIGWTLAAGQVVKYQAAQPLYAIALVGQGAVSVLDQSWEYVK